jgi:hypothetical protein
MHSKARIEGTYMHSRRRHAAQHTTRDNTTHQLKHTCVSRGPTCIREEDTQHNTQQETTQPTNSNTHAYRGDLHAFENKTRNTGHNKKHNPTTQTHMHIGIFNNMSNNRKQQFPRPVILIPDDDHIGRNM